MPRHWAEIGLIVAGLCLLVTAGWRVTERALFQSRPEVVEAFRPGLRLLGRLEIPRLGMAVLVVDGADENALSVAAGHVAGTAALGGSGNAVIAGHRDAEFRALRGIRVGDRLRVSADRTYVYVVRRILVVSRNDTRVLAPQSAAGLTLVTCYPFRYVGDAPERFIVQAELVGT